MPLSRAAIDLLKSLPRVPDSQVVFPGRLGGPLSNMSLSKVTRDMGVDAVPHGFRSTFRDWVGDATNHPADLAEIALAHVLENKTEAAYRRGDALQKRRLDGRLGKPLLRVGYLKAVGLRRFVLDRMVLADYDWYRIMGVIQQPRKISVEPLGSLFG